MGNEAAPNAADEGSASTPAADPSGPQHESVQCGPDSGDSHERSASPHSQSQTPPVSSLRDLSIGGPAGGLRYYRVDYRGVVSLLAEPDLRAQRSGVYVSFGEIVSTAAEEVRVVVPSPQGEDMATAIAVRVDGLLTGGYAVDAERAGLGQNGVDGHGGDSEDLEGRVGGDTPRTSNGSQVGSASGAGSSLSTLTVSDYFSLGLPSPLDRGDGLSKQTGDDHFVPGQHGYIFLSRPSSVDPIAVQIPVPPPLCEAGPFWYKVISSTPLPIMTGPCPEAPKVGRAVVMPGSVHQVSLRIQSDSVEGTSGAKGSPRSMFLRLSHRRGWLADRRTGAGSVVMAEVTVNDLNQTGYSDSNSVSAGSISSSFTLGTAVSRRRRRPPLRKRRGDLNASMSFGALSTWKDSQSHDNGHDNGHGLGLSSDRSPPTSPPVRALHQANSSVSGLSFLSSTTTGEKPERKEKGVGPNTYSQLALDESKSSVLSSANQSLTSGTEIGLQQVPAEPSYFLMRVTAPSGLKILESTKSQVNNLVRRQGTVLASTHKSKADGGFHTMGGTFANNPSILRTDSTDSAARTRSLPRGTLFESSKRSETAELYTSGGSLIKLADDSGWAIIPTHDELDAQYRTVRGGATGRREGEAKQAYEEVGNAITDAPSGTPTPQDARPIFKTVWMRIAHRGGVIVSCPPPPAKLQFELTRSPTDSTTGSTLSPPGSHPGVQSHDASSEVAASSIASSFLDSMFRTPRKAHGLHTSTRRSDIGVGIERLKARPPRTKAANSILSCGLCIEVAPCEKRPGGSQQQPSFLRLKGGQGWVPHHLNGQLLAVSIEPPKIQLGSFWFRIKCKRGIKVRHGPSRRANSIKNDEGEYFRFECGEFLRASEICTMRSDEHILDANQDHTDPPFESFAKLYRNNHIRNIAEIERLDYRPLDSLTAKGEWVQVFGGDRIYLEECKEPPKIECHRQCWRYDALCDGTIDVRRGPSYLSENTGRVLRSGETVMVNERVTAHGEHGAWLRLKDGQGWVHEVGDGNVIVMVASSTRRQSDDRRSGLARTNENGNRHTNDQVYNSLITKLFHEPAASKT